MEFTEENASPLDDRKIGLDLKNGLFNASENNQTENSSNPDSSREFGQSRSGFLDKFFAEQLCDFKNNVVASKLSNGLNSTGKSLVKEVYTTTDEEVQEYLKLLEYGCVNFLPDSWLDNMETFFKHPCAGVLKIEIMKYRMLCKKLDAFKEEPSSVEKGAA